MRIFILLLLSLATHSFAYTEQELKLAKEAIVSRSIEAYYGSCPCPYNTIRNGRRCGRVSAYSRPGGESPKCYVTDVTNQEAIQYLKKGN